MSYSEQYYPRKDQTVDSGNLGLTLQGMTSLTGGGRMGDKPTYSTLRTGGSASSVTEIDACNIMVVYNPSYATLNHDSDFKILYNPIVLANHNKCLNTATLDIIHLGLGITTAVFSV